MNMSFQAFEALKRHLYKNRNNRVWTTSVFLAVLTIFLFSDNLTAQEIKKQQSSPAWATERPIPAPIESRLEELSRGKYLLLSSIQRRYNNQTRETYVRYAEKVVNRQGLESAAKVNVDFRPEFDELTFHKIRVHRGDQKIDLLDNTKLQIFQRERDLEKGIIDGRKTAFANLPSVRVGDTVEVAFTLKYKTILMPNEFFSNFTLAFKQPVGVIERSVILPSTMEPNIKYSKKEAPPVVVTRNGETTYSWIAEDPEPLVTEAHTPAWYEARNVVDISTIKSWESVAQDSISHYQQQETLSDDFLNKLESIKNGTNDPKKIVSEVLTLIQNEIRYVGVEIGRGAFIPRPPSTVLSRGYGDCKDKTYLMVVALRKLGIDANPALAHLSKGQSITNRLPSPYLFNHVIVRAKVGDQIYFIDPTGTQQRSPDPLWSQANYGYVLPILSTPSGLEEITPVLPKKPQTTIFEKIELGYKKDTSPITLRVHSIYRGADADDYRRNLANNGVGHYKKIYQEYYSGLYGELTSVSPLTIDDDTSKNVIRTKEHYQSVNESDREKTFENLTLRADAVRSLLEKVSESSRNSPIFLFHPVHREHKIELTNLAGPLSPLETFEIDNEFLKLKLSSKADSNKLSANWIYESKANRFPAAKLDEYKSIRDNIIKQTDWYYDVRTSSLIEPEKDSVEHLEDHWQDFLLLGYVFVLPVFGVWLSLKKDRTLMKKSISHPIRLHKVIVMTVATFGLYSIFWLYRFWRWEKLERGVKAWPFWRAVFYIFWTKSTFTKANSYLQPGAKLLSHWGFVAFLFAALNFVLGFSDYYVDESARVAQWIILAVSVVCGFLMVLPPLLAVNRANFADLQSRMTMENNSEYSWINIIAIVAAPFAAYGLFST